MSECGLQSTFLGDVAFLAADTTISISQTVTGPTVYSWSETLARGAWFASPIHLVQYMVDNWNTTAPPGTGTMSARIDPDPTSSTYGKILITPDAGWGTISALVFAVGDSAEALACGLTSTSQDFGAVGSAEFAFTNACSYILTPFWPLTAFTRGVSVGSGYADMAHDGTSYSLVGHFRETVEVGVALDRAGGSMDEHTAWRALWNARWGAGRAVTLWVDSDDAAALAYTYNNDVGSADVLVVSDEGAGKAFRARRLVDWREYIDNQDNLVFAVKTRYGAIFETA